MFAAAASLETGPCLPTGSPRTCLGTRSLWEVSARPSQLVSSARVPGHVRRPGPWTWLGTRSRYHTAGTTLPSRSRREQTTDLEPTAGLGRCLYPPARGLDDVLDDRQAETASARGASTVGAEETLEEPRHVPRVDPDAVVRHREEPIAVLTPESDHGRRALAGVAKRIFGQVLDDDPQHPGAQRQLELLVLDLDLQCNPGSLGAFVELGNDLPKQRGRTGRTKGDDLTPGLELAEEEDVVDQLIHQLDLGSGLLQSGNRIGAGQGRTLDQSEQPRERRAQLV